MKDRALKTGNGGAESDSNSGVHRSQSHVMLHRKTYELPKGIIIKQPTKEPLTPKKKTPQETPPYPF